MGVFDKFKDLVGIEEYDDEEITEEEMQTTSAQLERRKVDNRPSGNYQRNRDKVVDMYSKNDSMRMILIEPKAFDECPKLVDSLKQNKPVILNLAEIDSETARKIFDFAIDAIESASAGLIPEHRNIFSVFKTPLSTASFATFNAVSYLSLPDIRFTVSPLAFS